MTSAVQVPVKVLLLTDETTQADSRSVATRRWAATAISLQATGCHVSLGTLRDFGPLNELVRDKGVDTFSLYCSGYRGIPRAAFRVARFIRQRRIDVVHGHEVIPGLIGALGSLIARRGVRIYFRSHTSSSTKHSFVSWFVARVTDVTMGGSAAVRDHAQRLDRTSPHKIRVVLNGVVPPRDVASEESRALKQALGIALDHKVVGLVSRFRTEKGIDTLLRAVPALNRLVSSPVHIVLVGSGPQSEELRDLASSLALDNVHFVGHQDDVAKWNSIADVIACPSLREALGLSVLEAMGCGKPVVASRVGGLPEVVAHGETGLLVSSGDPEELATSLSVVLEDDLLRERMGTAARARFRERFTIDRMAEGWAATYRELVPKR